MPNTVIFLLQVFFFLTYPSYWMVRKFLHVTGLLMELTLRSVCDLWVVCGKVVRKEWGHK